MTFVVVCGTDGSGKGTQVKLLTERLQREGREVEVADFPQYGQPSAALVEHYLNSGFGSIEDVSPYQASVFYACDRFGAASQIRKWLNEDKIVISNRYVSANKGHQMAQIKGDENRDKFLSWLDGFEYDLMGIPKEDANVLLYVPPEIGQQLVDQKAARDHLEGKKRDLLEADLGHLIRAAEAYQYVAKKESWRIIDCTPDGYLLNPEQINDALYNTIKDLLP